MTTSGFKPTLEDQAILQKVVETCARRYSKRTEVPYDDLMQEGWVHALQSYEKFRRLPSGRQQTLGGWVWQCLAIQISSYCRRQTCPVTFPKKKLPDLIRKGVTTVSDVVLSTRGKCSVDIKVDLGRALRAMHRRYPWGVSVLSGDTNVNQIIFDEGVKREEVLAEIKNAKKSLRIELRDYNYGVPEALTQKNRKRTKMDTETNTETTENTEVATVPVVAQPDDGLIDIGTAASIAGVTTTTVRLWLKDNRVASEKHGYRRFVVKESLDAHLATRGRDGRSARSGASVDFKLKLDQDRAFMFLKTADSCGIGASTALQYAVDLWLAEVGSDNEGPQA